MTTAPTSPDAGQTNAPCTVCGSPTVAGARFCHVCGHQLGSPRPPDGTERRVVTVLFGDLSDFTSWAEDLDPERVGRVTDRVLAALAQAVLDVGGHVDKLTGDGIMAVFGAPTAHEDDPERAVHAALEMQQAVGRLVADESGGRALGLRVGINTGEVLAGVQAALAYTVVGDTVNTASRLADVAAVGSVYVGRETAVSTMAVASWRALPLMQLKGKRDPVAVYELVGERPVDAPRLELGDEAPYLGRERELGALIAAELAVIESGEPGSLLMTGEAGIGKTRAAAELSRFVRELPGAHVLRPRASRYGVGQELGPLVELVRLACHVPVDAHDDEVVDAVRSTLAQLIGSGAPVDPDLERRLLAVLGTTGPAVGRPPLIAGGTEPAARESTVDDVAALVSLLARTGPVLVVVDDLQWATPVLLGLIDELIRRLLGPVLVVLVGRWAPDLDTVPSRPRLALEPLSPGASSELLTAYLGGVGLPDDARAALLDRAQGNPYFLAELLHLLVDRGVLVRGEQEWRVGGDGLPSGVLPSGVQAVLAARIDGLPPTVKSVLRSAAVLGVRFPAPVLTALGAGDPAAVDEVLHDLASRQLMRAPTTDDTRWAFLHPMARDVAYAGLPKAERARRHARAASWADDHLAGPRAEVAAFVASQAEAALELATEVTLPDDSPVWAVRRPGFLAAVRIGEAAARRDEPRAAMDLLQRALAMGQGLPEDDLMPAQLTLAGALASLRRLDEAEAALASPIHSPHASVRRRARTILGEVRQKQGRDADAVEALLGAFVEGLDEGDLGGAAAAVRQLGLVDYYAGRLTAAEQRLGQAAELAHEGGDDRGEAWALQHLAWSATTRGDYPLAERTLGTAAAIFEQLGDPGGLGWCSGTAALVKLLQGRLREARAVARRLLPLSESAAPGWDTAICLTIDALAAAELGDISSADEESARAEHLFATMGDDWGRSLALVAKGASARAAGRLTEALACLEEAVSVATDGSHPLTGTLALVGLGFVALDIGDVTRAAAVADRAAASLAWLDLRPQAALGARVLDAQVVRARGDPEQAVRLLQEAVGGGDEPTLLFPRRQALAHLAGSLIECGRDEEALRTAESAVAVEAEDVRSRVLALRALGTARSVCHDPKGARRAYRQALSVARSTAARGQLAVTEQLLRDLEHQRS